MINSSTLLIDFLNHGVLPFAGREDIISKIVGFSEKIIEGTNIGTILVSGEVGVGKSRFITETAKVIEASEGITIYTRLRPNSSLSLVSFIAKEISQNEIAGNLLRKPISPNLSSVVESLERLSHLRVVVLIIEDVHLAEGDSLKEISAILKSLEFNPITIIFTARPIHFPARAIIESNLLEELILTGLTQNEIDDVIVSLFGKKNFTVSEVLSKKTFGNPLVMRSALRQSIKKGHITQDPQGEWNVENEFISDINRSTNLFSEGMIIHLLPKELQAAKKIACLGEAFARETALALLSGEETMFRTLISKGIISESLSAVPPINKKFVSVYPVYAFTHTLLHEHLLLDAAIEAEQLLKLLGDTLPTYSFLIYNIIEKSNFSLDLSNKEYLMAIRRLCDDGFLTDQTIHWEMSQRILDIAELVLKNADDILSDEDKNYATASIYKWRIHTMVRRMYTDEFAEIAEKNLEAAMKVSGEKRETMVFQAMIQVYCGKLRRHQEFDLKAMWSEISNFIEANPALKDYTDFYDDLILLLLSLTSSGIRYSYDFIMFDMLKLSDKVNKMNDLLNTEADRLYIAVADALDLYSPEHYNIVISAIPKLDNPNIRESWLLPRKLQLYCKMFLLHELPKIADRIILIYTQMNLHCGGAYVIKALAQIAFGDKPSEINNELALILKGMKPPYDEWFINDIISIFSSVYLLTFQNDCFIELSNMTGISIEKFQPSCLITIDLDSGNAKEVIARLFPEHSNNGIINFAEKLLCKDDIAEALNILNRYCNEFLPTIYGVAELSTYLQVITHYAKTNKETISCFQPHISPLLEQSLKVFAENKLDFLLDIWLNKFGSFINKGQRKFWKKELSIIKKFHVEENKLKAPKTTDKIMLSLIGDVKYRMPQEQDFIRLQGGRTRRLIGAIVAQELTKNSLDEAEFIRLVLDERDIDEKSQHALNVVVSRLREALGKNSIITSQKTTPRFNPDYVMVDMFECIKNLKKIRRNLRSENLLVSFRAAMQTLDMWNGKVPFPTLYDEVFEDLRTDFENQIRASTLNVGRVLLNGNDNTGVERIAKNFLKHIPDDEEFLELQERNKKLSIDVLSQEFIYQRKKNYI